MGKKTLTIAACLLFVCHLASAHDFWLQPETSFPAPQCHLNVRLFVGMDLSPMKEHPYEKARIDSFVVKGPGAIDVKPVEGRKPFVQIPLAASGDVLVVLVRKQAHIELSAEEFNGYVAHEGLPQILEHRKKNGTVDKPARENYTRYLKTLARVGGGDGRLFLEPTGDRMEIVPLSDPLALKPGSALPVKVLFEGNPLAGVTVFAYGRHGTTVSSSSSLTGSDGTTSARISTAGIWSLRLIHMRECHECKDADWESYWSSLTFEVR